MAGREGGVQAILRKKYTKALYFHCSSHKLNLAVNDASKLSEIRNCVSIVKDCINFFRESTARRRFAPNLSRLCETRWSEKYKSMRRFSENFCEVAKALDILSKEGNYNTKKSSFQLHAAITKPIFIITLLIVAKYSAILEPTVNVLQSVSLAMVAVSSHIGKIIDMLNDDRINAEKITHEILDKALTIGSELFIDISVPRLTERQQHRSNPPSANVNEFWRRSIVIPYLDSLLSSLKYRFPEENSPAFSLSHLHPLYMAKYGFEELEKKAKIFGQFYEFENMLSELRLWYNSWKNKNLSNDELQNIEVVQLYIESKEFFSQIKTALLILSALPCTIATVERSFSTLRRVKTWLRSTVGEERLSGLCLMSVHRKMINENIKALEKQIMDLFSANPRRLLLK